MIKSATVIFLVCILAACSVEKSDITAPPEPGTYTTAWQAIDPNGDPFGDAVFMEIVVQVEVQVTLEIIEGE